MPDLPAELRPRRKARAADTDGAPIPEGGRNAALASLAGSMRRRGMTAAEMEAALQVTNRERCQGPPLPETEVAAIARSVARYAPDDGETGDDAGGEAVQPTTLLEVIRGFRRWLYLPDLGALIAALGAVAANRLPGDPVWLLIVAPSGWGKTEVLGPLAALPDVHPAATLTEAALLSGTPAREKVKGRQGGTAPRDRRLRDRLVQRLWIGPQHAPGRPRVSPCGAARGLRRILDAARRHRWWSNLALDGQSRADRRLHADDRQPPGGHGANGRAVSAYTGCPRPKRPTSALPRCAAWAASARCATSSQRWCAG